MFRVLSRTSCLTRNSAAGIYESSALSPKCDKVSRALNGRGVNAFSTHSARLCEKKDQVVTSNQDENINAGEEDKQQKMVEQKEEAVVVKADDRGATQQQSPQVVAATPTELKSDGAKSGKETLLGLLGAMKVEVTNKRKLKDLKTKQHFESATQFTSKPQKMESTISMFQKAAAEASSQSETLEPTLVAAASAAAATLPNQKRAESELLRQLRQRKALTEAQKKGDLNNLGDIIADMKVGKKASRQSAGGANQIQFDEDGRGYSYSRGITSELAGVRRRRNLLSTKRLNIFSPPAEEDGGESAVAKPTLWDVDFTNQLVQVTNHKPRNGFEEMIQWTKEGKLWQYPINNEAGLEEEVKVPFHEHIFLEKHLEEGFPRQGPVRHFMELVVAGLCKNPYLTVQQKKEHISWFRDYFHQKEEVLNEADVYLN
ncbi:28S ribosomal protein S31, mitochondrial [Cololabis saira]|uniref:28S ribosomal protein S31, mitochondrial n=1 Tax=Cololabis saira TaxID=129043 RepID=UPI002AD340DB|nr:28S ribosomal protein S31, mitochondrial [Cololabis saira]